MKITVKHEKTEIIIQDEGLRTDTNFNLIYYNQDYILKLLKEITEKIIQINYEKANSN
jgi:transcriptional regulator of NAD metabolism